MVNVQTLQEAKHLAQNVYFHLLDAIWDASNVLGDADASYGPAWEKAQQVQNELLGLLEKLTKEKQE